MSKLTRSSFVITIAASLFVCGAHTFQLSHKISRLRVDLDHQTDRWAEAQTALLKAKTDIHALSGELMTARVDVQTALMERQRATADAHALRLLAQVAELEKVNVGIERDKARQELARFHTAGLEPEQIVHAREYIDNLEATVTKLHAENQVLQKKVAGFRLAAGEPVPELPSDLKGSVLACDPKWRFIVIGVGQQQGAVSRGEMLVSRQGKLVAKVRISRVEKDRCIANILPNWDLGEVAEGDLAQPAPSAI